jgi:putative tryptophan/tyrosine transport system substrate-binding protein
MKRREFITLIGGAAVAWPLVAPAQQPAKMKRVAMVNVAIKPEDMKIGGNILYAILLEEVKRLGYVEGVNLIVDRYSAERRFDRFAEIAHEVVATGPDVIYTVGNPLTLAFKSETRAIPIVAYTGDPVAAGIVSSLARPGGNISGVSGDAGPELGGKRIQLLAEAVGKLSNVRVLGPPTAWEHPATKALRQAAEGMKIPVRFEPLQTPINETEYRRAFDAMQRDHVDGVAISGDPENYVYGHLLGLLAQQYRLPAISTYPETAETGALMSYAFDVKAGTRRIAAQIVEILNGGKPAEMPYFIEAHFELVINLKAAKEIGLEIPAGLIAQADRVIE